MTQSKKGNALAALAFVFWGMLPLYYQLLPNADTKELLALRLIASLPIMLLLAKFAGAGTASLATIFADKKSLFMCFVSTALMSVSWYAFIWALTHGQVLAASLGFFITPLFVILFGVLFLREKLSAGQQLAVLFGLAGLGFQIWQYGELPWISLVMGGVFALYGLAKKWVRYDAITSVTVETAWLVPAALIYMIWQIADGSSAAINGGTTTFMLYLGAAPMTLIPVLLFSMAVRYTSLTMVGIFQYIEPSLQFVLALLVFGEAFDGIKAISFALIWCGLLACSCEVLLRRRKKQPLLQNSLG